LKGGLALARALSDCRTVVGKGATKLVEIGEMVARLAELEARVAGHVGKPGYRGRF
jgi:hypothetical protein